MTKVTRIPTENPIRDQWRLLGQYGYPENVLKYLWARHIIVSDPQLPEFVSGCINQADSYFRTAATSPLNIAPLLLYYGATNLMLGVAALRSGFIRPIRHHGLRLRSFISTPSRIADYQVTPCNPNDGAFQWFLESFSRKLTVAGFGDWSLGEIFGSVPDLRTDFELCYETDSLFTIPVDVESMEVEYRDSKQTKHRVFYDRLRKESLARFTDPIASVLSVEGFTSAYLNPAPPGHGDGSLRLNRKMRSTEIGFYSIYGKKFLELPHVKHGRLVTPNQLIVLLTGLFALGSLSRYHPQTWNVFVRSDKTGERLIIEKYLSIAERYIPNLLLNSIAEERFEFLHPSAGPVIEAHATISLGR